MTLTAPSDARVAELWNEPGTRSQTQPAPRPPASLRMGASRSAMSNRVVESTRSFGAILTWDGFVLPNESAMYASATEDARSADLAAQCMNIICSWLDRQIDQNAAFPLAHAAAVFLGRLIRVDRPTPQIGSNGADGLEIEWLVAETSLTIDIASESEILIYAIDPAGREMFAKEITSRWTTGDQIFADAEKLLDEMAAGVVTRAPLGS